MSYECSFFYPWIYWCMLILLIDRTYLQFVRFYKVEIQKQVRSSYPTCLQHLIVFCWTWRFCCYPWLAVWLIFSACSYDLFVFFFICAHNRTAYLLQDPFVFSPYHKAIREPFDYYMFGQNYIRPLVDFRLSKNLLSFWTHYCPWFLCLLQHFSRLSTAVWTLYNHVT